jgi:hypothetical protein
VNDGYWKQKRLETLRRQLKNMPRLSLKDTQRAIGKKGEVRAMHVYAAYLQSEALVTEIARNRGESWIPRLMTRLREGATFQLAFEEVIGITPERALEQLHHEWD